MVGGDFGSALGFSSVDPLAVAKMGSKLILWLIFSFCLGEELNYDWYLKMKKMASRFAVTKENSDLRSCPPRCICYQEGNVRCMFLRLRKIPPHIYENTQRL